MNTEPTTDATQEPKCPATGEQKQETVDASLNSCIPKIFRLILETIAEGSTGEQKKALLELDEKSELYFIVHSAFLAGINWTMQVPMGYAVREFSRVRRDDGPSLERLKELVKELEQRLSERPDEVEATDGK